MSETIIELNGQRYKQLPSGWIDADTYLTPPLVIIQELNRRHIKPAQPSKSTEARRQSAGPARNHPGHSFKGLQLSDFQTNTDGTTWRRDTSLGGLLSQTFRDRTGRDFVQHAVSRRQQVLLGQPPRFDRHNTDRFNLRPAKFFFSLDDVHAYYGFYVEKPDYPNCWFVGVGIFQGRYW